MIDELNLQGKLTIVLSSVVVVQGESKNLRQMGSGLGPGIGFHAWGWMGWVEFMNIAGLGGVAWLSEWGDGMCFCIRQLCQRLTVSQSASWCSSVPSLRLETALPCVPPWSIRVVDCPG